MKISCLCESDIRYDVNCNVLTLSQGGWKEEYTVTTKTAQNKLGFHKCKRARFDAYGDIYQHDICERCKQLGRLCTWTRAIEECPLNDRRVTIFRPAEPVEISSMIMPEPEMGSQPTYYSV